MKSEVDYTKLRAFLAAQRWKEADRETLNVMLQATGRKKDGWLDINACRNFPQVDLRIIDQLWLEHSNNKFGFSVQKQIWSDCGGKVDGSDDDYTILGKLADKVGWRTEGIWHVYDELNFNVNTPDGHLPWWFGIGELLGSGGYGGGVTYLFFKLT